MGICMCKINLYNCDCMEVMKDIPDSHYELAIVDPPYNGNDAIETYKSNSKNKACQRKVYKQFKNIAPDREYFEELKRVSRNQIIWGCNFYKNYDLTGGRLVWDKKGTAFGRAEMAYLSMTKSVNIFEYVWNGMLQGDMKNKEIRIHPTQKPVALYRWLLQNYAKEGDKILDTHGGSMSIAIACYDMSFDLDLCELGKDYFEAGKKRLEKHQTQSTLLDFC